MTLLAFLMAVLLGGCGPADKGKGGNAMQDPHEPMITHIAKEHGILIGAGTNVDICVSTAGNLVTVRFSPETLRRLPADCLPVLRFDGPERSLTEADYNQFLENLHDYLLLTYGEGGHVPKK